MMRHGPAMMGHGRGMIAAGIGFFALQPCLLLPMS